MDPEPVDPEEPSPEDPENPEPPVDDTIQPVPPTEDPETDPAEPPLDDPNVTDDPVTDDGEYVGSGQWAIGDQVWRDSNRDGIQNNSEPGIYKVRVQLFETGREVPWTTYTDYDGGYSFNFAGNGCQRFRIQVEMDGYLSTYQHAAGSNKWNDSDINSSGRTREFGMASVDSNGGGSARGTPATLPVWINTTIDAGLNPEPVVTLSVPTEVQVNADNDNGSAWKSPEQKYIPKKRDFEVAGPTPYEDQQLKAATVTVENPIPGTIKVDIVPQAGTKVAVKIFADRQKNPMPASAPVPVPANGAAYTFTFYVEGTHESESTMDQFVFLATYHYKQGASRRFGYGLVTPVLESMRVSIPDKSVSFLKTGPVASGADGIIAADMTPGNRKPGIAFLSDLTITVGCDVKRVGYVQNVERVDSGINVNDGKRYAAKVISPAGNYRFQLSQAPEAQGAAAPLLDAGEGNELTSWPFYEVGGQNENGQCFMHDSPNLQLPGGGGLRLNMYDFRWQFMTYLVVQF